MDATRGLTIKDIADRNGITTDTVRYYEKIGLLPRAERKRNRHRVYGPDDAERIRLIGCLKKTGMSLEEMKPFMSMYRGKEGIRPTPELYELMEKHREKIREQIHSLQQVLDFIDDRLTEGRVRGEECAVSEGKTKEPLAGFFGRR